MKARQLSYKYKIKYHTIIRAINEGKLKAKNLGMGRNRGYEIDIKDFIQAKKDGAFKMKPLGRKRSPIDQLSRRSKAKLWRPEDFS